MTRLVLAAPLLVLALSGCAGPSYRMTTDHIGYSALDPEVLRSPCRSQARVCVTNPKEGGFTGSVNEARTGIYASIFAWAGQVAASPEQCDLAVRFPNTWNDFSEVSTPSGRFLALFEVSNIEASARAVCRALAPGGSLAGKVALRAVSTIAAQPDDATPAVAASAPSQGLSAADIERIAKAVRGGDAPAATPSAPSLAPAFSAAERPDDLAVIVGIEGYSDIASKAQYAERDAESFKSYVRALGVPERNVVLLTGSKATRSALVKNVEGWLPRMAKPGSRVYFYFSGHGAPDVKSGQAYLVPWDGDPNFLDSTAYPVSQLYKKLGELPAKQVLVAMDSCFSGAGGRSVLASGARPLVGKIETGAPPAKVTILAASASNEISGSLDAQQHGAFTYFLLEGLNAGKTTPKALAAYLTPRVQDEARRLNRDQTPQLQGDGSWSLR